MAILVLPESLAQRAGVPRELELAAPTARLLLHAARARSPELGRWLLDEAGEPRRLYSLFLADDPLGDLDRPLPPDAVVTVLAPVSGGLGRQDRDVVPPPRLPAWLEPALTHAQRSGPEEAVGLVLAGTAGRRVVPARNAAPHPREVFAIDPGDLVRMLAEAQERGERLEAIYHSHPGGAAALSGEDLRQALYHGAPLWPGLRWIVLAPGPQVRAFVLDTGGPVEVPLEDSPD